MSRFLFAAGRFAQLPSKHQAKRCWIKPFWHDSGLAYACVWVEPSGVVAQGNFYTKTGKSHRHVPGAGFENPEQWAEAHGYAEVTPEQPVQWPTCGADGQADGGHEVVAWPKFLVHVA